MSMRHTAPETSVWIVEPQKNCGGKFTVHDTDLICYTKKQMKSIYPKGDYIRVGEFAFGSKREKTGLLDYSVRMLPIFQYGAHSRLLYRERGFAPVGEDRYAVLLKNTALPRSLALVLCAAVVAAGVIFGPGLLTARPPQYIADENMALAQEPITSLSQNGQGAVIDTYLTVPVLSDILIGADRTDAAIGLRNPASNTCNLVIRLALSDGTILFTSAPVAPGETLGEVTLSEPLAAGEYSAIIQYEAYSTDGKTLLTTAEVQIALIVQ